MLEYYTMKADYKDALAVTEELFAYLAKESDIPPVAVPFGRLTVAQAFELWAGIDLFQAVAEESGLENAARKLGLDPAPAMTTHALYDLIFIHAVEPALKMEKPIVLIDYPAFVPCLAKKSPNGRTVDRWELYYNGIELANCFSEETNPQIVKEFFISEEEEKKKNGIVQHAVDYDYCKIFENGGFPRCSGVAMGLDRLIMALTNCSNIDGVLPMSRPISL
jgi:lysyl-tRNA synthetase class 2